MSNLHLYFILLFLLGIFPLYSQLPDSVLSVLDQIPTEKEKVEWLTNRSIEITKSDPVVAYPYIKEAQIRSGQISDIALIASLDLAMGKIQTDLVNYDSALIYASKAKKAYESLEDSKGLAESLLGLEGVYSKTGELKLAMENALNASSLYGAVGEKENQAKALERVANIHWMQREFEQSLDYCDQAEVLLKEGESDEVRGNIQLTRGYVYLLQSYYDLALEQMTLCIESYTRAKVSPITLSSAYNGRGNVYKHMEQFEAAVQDYQNNLRICEASNYKRGIMISNANIGHALVLNEQYSEAINYLNIAREQMEATNDRANLWEQYMHLTTAYEQMGDYKNALHYHQLYYAENENYYEDRIDQLESEIETKYETGQRAATIVLQEQTIDQQRKNQLITFGFLGLLTIILGLVYYNFRNTKRLSKELEKKNEEKELLLKEIHHRVKNNLQTISSLLNLQSANIKDKKVLGAVIESKNRVRSMALIHQKLYQGENLVAIEMKEYLENLCGNMIKSYGGSSKNISLKCEMQEIELDVDTAIPIGLITNELITNSLKYAFPNGEKGVIEVALSLDENQEVLSLKVADNGVGMNSKNLQPDERRSNFGSQLVQLLSTQLEGNIDSSSDQGYQTLIEFKKFKVYPSGNHSVNN